MGMVYNGGVDYADDDGGYTADNDGDGDDDTDDGDNGDGEDYDA